ncbi:MAG: hypothetical protein KatS3mg105_0098 [Gemmatales bacterium]|nr:MAG: hypothetical protein KatS3mg105_0098 [Gemmatales bacterium]
MIQKGFGPGAFGRVRSTVLRDENVIKEEQMNRFRTEALKELTDQQVRFAPPARRLEQAARAQRLLREIDEGKQYPYQYVCYRVTDYRPESYPDLVISGSELREDLSAMIAELARSLPAQPVESFSEPVVTSEELQKQFNVSAKTIQRWRKRGLVGIPVISRGRRQIGFLQSFLLPFLAENQEKVARGSRFSQMTDEEKEEILRRARRLARAGSLTEVSRRIARRLGRSPEAVRYTIKKFDEEHPDCALYPGTSGPLNSETKNVIYSSYRRGISVDTLARRFRRTRNSMYRVINEIRARRLLEQPLEYIYHESFDDPNMEAGNPGTDAGSGKVRRRAPEHARPQGRVARAGAPFIRCRCSTANRKPICFAR